MPLQEPVLPLREAVLPFLFLANQAENDKEREAGIQELADSLPAEEVEFIRRMARKRKKKEGEEDEEEEIERLEQGAIERFNNQQDRWGTLFISGGL